jgi:hypothetical protein
LRKISASQNNSENKSSVGSVSGLAKAEQPQILPNHCDMLTDKYEIDPEEINKEWGVEVGQQRNFEAGTGGGGLGDWDGDGDNDGHRMSDEEYYKRYGHHRNRINFLSGVH